MKNTPLSELQTVRTLYSEQQRYLLLAHRCKPYGRSFNKYIELALDCKERALKIVEETKTFLENS